MEYLDMSFSKEDKVKPNQAKIDLIIGLSNQGLSTKEAVDIDKITSEYGASDKKLLEAIMKSKPDGQDKAIVQALISRYPKLDTDKGEIKEFGEHLRNMMTTNVISDGAIRNLLEILLLKQTGEKPKVKQPKEKEDTQQPEVAEAQNQEGGDAQADVSQGMDTNNSDLTMDDDAFYDNWEMELSGNTDLTEDDFSDIIGDSIESLVSSDQEVINAESKDSHLRSSEERKKLVVNPAIGFLRSKYKGGLAKNESYSGQDGFTLAATFLIKKDMEFSCEGDKERDFLNCSEATKEKEIAKSKAYKFFNKKFKVRSAEKRYSRGPSMVGPANATPSIKTKNRVSSGTDIVHLGDDADGDGEKDFKLDVRGNLVTDKPKIKFR